MVVFFFFVNIAEPYKIKTKIEVPKNNSGIIRLIFLNVLKIINIFCYIFYIIKANAVKTTLLELNIIVVSMANYKYL